MGSGNPCRQGLCETAEKMCMARTEATCWLLIRERKRERERQREREKETDRQGQRQRQRDSETDGERQTERDRDRETQRETETEEVIHEGNCGYKDMYDFLFFLFSFFFLGGGGGRCLLPSANEGGHSRPNNIYTRISELLHTVAHIK